jgi:hypothetical protein
MTDALKTPHNPWTVPPPMLDKQRTAPQAVESGDPDASFKATAPRIAELPTVEGREIAGILRQMPLLVTDRHPAFAKDGREVEERYARALVKASLETDEGGLLFAKATGIPESSAQAPARTRRPRQPQEAAMQGQPAWQVPPPMLAKRRKRPPRPAPGSWEDRSIDGFCVRHNWSRQTYYNRRAASLGPEEIQPVPGGRVTITEAAERAYDEQHARLTRLRK